MTQNDLKTIFDNIDKRLLAKFKKFHQENPDVYRKFREYARNIRSRGHKRYSGQTIIELIRWEHDIKTLGDAFKINNDFVALYSRLLIFHDPSFDGFFNLRVMKPFGRKLSGEERERLGVQ